MKYLDRFLQQYRLRMARPYIEHGVRVLDVGCFDQLTWQSLPNIRSYTGIDPNVETQQVNPTVKLVRGFFPGDLHGNDEYDLILMLATLEHIPLLQWPALVDTCYARLAAGGKFIATVPSPTVDNVLLILKTLRLIDGMDLEQHQHIKPKDVVPQHFGTKFRPVVHRRFQLGLNHLFVYSKV